MRIADCGELVLCGVKHTDEYSAIDRQYVGSCSNCWLLLVLDDI